MSQNSLCKVCGRFFEANSNSDDQCPECKKKDDEMYEAVRNYLMEKPRSSIFEVTSELKIPIKVIKRFLREDRLEIVEAQNSFLKCESCGKSISSGYFCRDCKTLRNLKHKDSEPVQNENQRIHDDEVDSSSKIKFL